MWREHRQWTLGRFLALALLGAARADLGLWGPPGFVQADQQFLDFGNVVVGSLSSPRTLTFQNYGAATVTVGSLQLRATDGATDTPFRIVPVGTTCVPATNLVTVQTCTISVVVAPLALGKFQGSLYMNLYIVLTGALFQTTPVLLQVNAVPPAPVPSPVPSPSPSPSPVYATSLAGHRHPSERITANPTTLEFGNFIVGSSSSKKTITFTNAGTDSVEVAAIMLSAVDVPPAGAGFVLGVVDGSQASQDQGFTLAGGTCAPGMSVPPGASCTVKVKAAPTVLGSNSAQVYLSVNTAVAIASSDKVLLHATAVAQPSPSPIARKSLRR